MFFFAIARCLRDCGFFGLATLAPDLLAVGLFSFTEEKEASGAPNLPLLRAQTSFH